VWLRIDADVMCGLDDDQRADDDPLNANDRINKYMDSRVTKKESSFKDFEKTLHYDPNAF
jgi:hypothetical protein